MESLVKNQIEYFGLARSLPQLSSKCSYKQLAVQQELTIPETKPDIEKIVRISEEISINSSRIAKALKDAAGISKILTANKLIVEGDIVQKIEYIAEIPLKPVSIAYLNIPFNLSIALHENYDLDTQVIARGYILDSSVELLSKRKILKRNIIVILVEA